MMSRHWKISSGHHFQNGHHNTTQIQHFPISATFHLGRLWCSEIPDIEQFLPVAIFKMATTIPQKFNIVRYHQNLICVPNWFLTLKNFYRLPFSKWPPQYHTNSTLFDFNEISYVGRLWWPELIPGIDKFLPVSIFKMATTIPQKFNIVRFQR